jgi:hypothetical protein
MCYEESFFRRWAKKRAEYRQKSEAVVEREPLRQPAQPTSEPTTTTNPKRSKQPEREVEVV